MATQAMLMAKGAPLSAVTWGDEFDYVGPPDPAKWGVDGNAWVDGSKLIQTVTGTNQNDLVHSHLRSADVTPIAWDDGYLQIDNRLFGYGRLDIRMKASSVRGIMSSAFTFTDWLNLSGNSWFAGETDLAEVIGYDADTAYCSTHHWEWENDFAGSRIDLGQTDFVEFAEGQFHVYSAIWAEDSVRVLVDGQQVHQRDMSGDGQPGVFGQSRGIILDTWAVYSTAWWGGEQGVDYAALPAVCEVDYVRWYAE